MDKSKNPVLFAAHCAEQVLAIFESAYPTDDRPRKAIEAARSGASVPAARAAAFAAHAAARDATDIAAVYAARAAGHAAATIHVAAHAPHAADYAAKAALEVKKRSAASLGVGSVLSGVGYHHQRPRLFSEFLRTRSNLQPWPDEKVCWRLHSLNSNGHADEAGLTR